MCSCRGFRLCPGRMAGETFLIIGCRFMLKLLMGIMAGHTGETRVAVAPALAVFQTIRLKARVDGSGDANLHFVDVGPGTMTGAAEVYRSDWA